MRRPQRCALWLITPMRNWGIRARAAARGCFGIGGTRLEGDIVSAWNVSHVAEAKIELKLHT